MNNIVKFYADKTTLYYPKHTDMETFADTIAETFADTELPHDWVDEKLQLSYNSFTNIDSTFIGCINNYQYYSSNDDYEFYFLYDTTLPISWNTLSNISKGFSFKNSTLPSTLPDIDNHLLDIVNYRKNRIRGDDISYHF